MAFPIPEGADLTVDLAVRGVALAVFATLALYGGLRDIASFTIPNRVSLGIVAAFGVAVLAGHPPPTALAGHVGAAVVVFAVGWGLFHFNIFGGGDVKLMSAAALWAGFGQLAGLVLLVACFGGLLTLAMLAGRLLPTTVTAAHPVVSRLVSGQHGVPYGMAIAAAVWTNFIVLPLVLGRTLT